jgi:alkanesulfonate monooxygenase SsuD/methylene tetrahydromethanopterin reductase-like flavin-dependent oxidoreductase (luciferase family)
MNFGIYLNNRAAVFLPDYTLDELLALGVEAEELGYHSVWLGDRLLSSPRYDPIVTLAAIGARTRTVQLGTSVLLSHMRNPVVLALEWATLDTICHGRTIMGLGLGGGRPDTIAKDCAAVGIEKRHRGKVFEESIEVLKALWTQESVTFDGRFYQLNDVALGYKPWCKPHPPIWIAAGYYNPVDSGTGPTGYHVEGEAGTYRGPFERVARLADGWFTEAATVEEYAATFDFINRTAREKYRRDESLHRALIFWINIGSDASSAYEEAKWMAETYHQSPFDEETLGRWLIHGDAEGCIERIKAYEQIGVETLVLVPAGRDHGQQIRRIAEEIFPAFAR